MVSGTTSHLYDVHFPATDTGYAVGSGGTVLMTTNAGNSWTGLVTGSTADLHAVYFINTNVGFVAGDSGIYRTSDGGSLWQPVSIPTNEALRDLEFVSDQVGFAVGMGAGVILKTTDAGNTWAVKDSVSGNLTSLSFPDPDTGYCVRTGYNWQYMKTVDGGETWNNFNIGPLINLSSLETIFFTDVNTGFIGGWYLSALVRTSDGGNTWENKDTLGTVQLYSIYFPSPAVGYAVGWNNAVGISATIDSGKTWVVQNSNSPNLGIYYAVYFTDDFNGYIVGSDGVILKTSNGGVSGINQPAGEDGLIVYPNPAVSGLNIRLPGIGNWDITIAGASGKAVFRKNVLNTGEVSLPVNQFKSGAYIITVTDKGKSYRQKVVIGKLPSD